MRRILLRFRAMDPQTVQNVAAVANVILALAALTGSVAVALFVHYAQARSEQLSFFHSLGAAWIEIDLAALTDDELLVVADNLMDPTTVNDDIKSRKKRWFAYAVMNVVLARYKAAEDGILEPKDEVIAGCRDMLKALVKDDEIYQITQGHGYEPWMSAVCRELRQDHIATRPSIHREWRTR
jgi:hypothetical protein